MPLTYEEDEAQKKKPKLEDAKEAKSADEKTENNDDTVKSKDDVEKPKDGEK